MVPDELLVLVSSLFHVQRLDAGSIIDDLLTRSVPGRRDQVIIGTKFGFHLKDGKQVGTETASRPEYIREAVESLLLRLQTDYIDLLYQHRVDPKVPMEDVAGTVGDLVKEGKVRFYGNDRSLNDQFPGLMLCSVYQDERLRAALQKNKFIW